MLELLDAKQRGLHGILEAVNQAKEHTAQQTALTKQLKGLRADWKELTYNGNKYREGALSGLRSLIQVRLEVSGLRLGFGMGVRVRVRVGVKEGGGPGSGYPFPSWRSQSLPTPISDAGVTKAQLLLA